MPATSNFTGSIPEYYDTHLGPAWFDAFAIDLAQRLPTKPAGAVLETACGTGLVTRRIRERLDPAIRLVASDFSKPMLDYARGQLGEKGIEWREADAGALPFGDGEFGAVVCAFGFMFVPDKQAAFREARRVLNDKGLLLFDTWDRVEESAHEAAAGQLMQELFPGEPDMHFNTPHVLHDPALLTNLLAGAGFRNVKIEKRRLPMDRVSARTLATGLIRGTPRSLLLGKRGVSLDDAVERLTAALEKIGGADPYRGSAQALMVEAR